MRATIRLIGRAIKDGSHYTPIRFRAARLASRAKPKDYLGQAREVFNDFVQRWRYVKDPTDRELVVTSPVQIYETVMGGDNGTGHGDCDDATVAVGAQLHAIGFPVRIATIAPAGAPPGRLMSHVFAQCKIPNIGWVTVDPVVYPDHGFGYLPPHARLVTWNLEGKIINQYGNAQGMSGLGGASMQGERWPDYSRLSGLGEIDQWTDYAGFGEYLPENYPLEAIPDFRTVIKDYGIYSESMGIMGGLGLIAEVTTDETGRAWTPALEISPEDYEYMQVNPLPYEGMLGLGDNGDVYQYDGNLGFFRRLFKRIKRGVKKVARKVLRKIPGGKYLMKLGKKVWKVAKKFVRPLAKFVGKYATKLAPVAALIPGYGPAIAAGLYTAGRVAKLMNKYDVMLTGKKGKPRKLKFKSGKQAKRFQKALKKAASKLKRSKRSRKARRRGGRRFSARGSRRFRDIVRRMRARRGRGRRRFSARRSYRR